MSDIILNSCIFSYAIFINAMFIGVRSNRRMCKWNGRVTGEYRVEYYFEDQNVSYFGLCSGMLLVKVQKVTSDTVAVVVSVKIDAGLP